MFASSSFDKPLVRLDAHRTWRAIRIGGSDRRAELGRDRTIVLASSRGGGAVRDVLAKAREQRANCYKPPRNDAACTCVHVRTSDHDASRSIR
jgi:hypothetical protein